MKNARVTVDGDTHAVDNVEEAANLSDESGRKTKLSPFTSVTRVKSRLRRLRIPTSTTKPATTGSGVLFGNWSTC